MNSREVVSDIGQPREAVMGDATGRTLIVPEIDILMHLAKDNLI